MAYFTWKGIDLEGSIHKGKLFARSSVELDALLFKQEIALLSCAPAKQLFFLGRTIHQSQKIQFFKQCAQLLEAGVLLPDALTVIYSQTHHRQWHIVLATISNSVCQGSSLSQALEGYPMVFDSVMINMVHVGQESGRLVESLGLLSDYLTTEHEFGNSMRSAAMVPMITLGFFAVIALAIFIFIIPHFITMFESVKQELPAVTRMMIASSDFFRSWYVLLVIGLIAVSSIVVRSFITTQRGAFVWDSFLLRMPCVGFLITQSSLANFLQAMAMLISGGMHVVPALAVAKGMIGNKRISHHIEIIEKEVQAGSSLSQAMVYEPGQIFGAHAIAIIKVGEESGRLTVLLNQTARMYQESIKKQITLLTTLINPLLMIILGLLITFLVFAVYLPVFNLSNVM